MKLLIALHMLKMTVVIVEKLDIAGINIKVFDW